METIDIYTDGSSDNSKSKDKGGWAIVFVRNNKIVKEYSGAYNECQNGKAELYALYHAIKKAVTRKDKFIFNIYSDSMYCVDAYNKWLKGWIDNNFKNGKIKFQDIWRNIDNMKHKNINVKWIKGHSGNEFNERADYLSKEARK